MEAMRIHLGKVDQIAIGHAHCFRIGEHEVAIFRSRDGLLSAIDNKCPHKEGPLAEGITGDGKVVCPLHGHKFDLKTGQGSEPLECVKTFKVWEENKNIVLQFDFSITKSKEQNCAAAH